MQLIALLQLQIEQAGFDGKFWGKTHLLHACRVYDLRLGSEEGEVCVCSFEMLYTIKMLAVILCRIEL